MDSIPSNSGAATISRRAFGLGSLAVAAIAVARPTRREQTPIARFFGALDDDWKSRICFPFDHPSRTRVAENWAIVEESIGDLPPRLGALCREIVLGLGDEAWRHRLLRVMEQDSGGLGAYHAALFGRPDRPGPCEFVLTGRHLTLRANGHRPGEFSRLGPIFYGHSSPFENAWRYQDDRARDLFRSLDDRQRERAFSGDGIGPEDMDPSQAGRFRDLLATLSPFLATAPHPAGFRLICHPGDSGDGFASIWRVNGNGMSWSYHGIPHVHARLEFAGA